MPRPIRAVIHRAALAANLQIARRHAPGSRVWAVVKANAYGHGIERAYVGMAPHADGFALLDLAEAERIRALGWRGPILLLEGCFEARDLDAVQALGLTIAVHDDARIAELAALKDGPPVEVMLKVNSGMNRLGFRGAAVHAAWERLRALPKVGKLGCMTHFANADAPDGIADAMAEFDAVTAGLPGERSLSNSAAVLRFPQAHRDWVRPGIMQYGATPFADVSAAQLGLQPTMTLASRLIAVQNIAAGAAVGYGSAFVAPAPMRIGVVACGYADGYPRIARNGTPVWVEGLDGTGALCPLAGRVSMDMLTIDLTAAPWAVPGTPVELWGRHVPIDEVAAGAGTVGYELMCALALRVPVEVSD